VGTGSSAVQNPRREFSTRPTTSLPAVFPRLFLLTSCCLLPFLPSALLCGSATGKGPAALLFSFQQQE